MKPPKNLPIRWLSLAIGVAAVGCGGATSSDLLNADGSSGVDAAVRDTGPFDGSQPPDSTHPADTSPVDVVPVDVTPVDTGPKDTGPPPLPAVKCGTSTCPVPGGACCITTGDASFDDTFVCETPPTLDECRSGGGSPVECAEGADCPGGECCGIKDESGLLYAIVECVTSCNTGAGQILFCNPLSSSDVTACEDLGGTCVPSTIVPGLNVCK
jgi:hypothetical protein